MFSNLYLLFQQQQMGNTESQKWQSDYDFLTQSAPTRLIQHRQSKQTFQLVSLYPNGEDGKTTIINRLKLRQSQKSEFIDPIYKCFCNDSSLYCGDRPHFDIMFKTSPTLRQLFASRVNRSQRFSVEEIEYVITRVALGLKDIKQIRQEHGNIDLSTIIVDGNIRVSDPLTIKQRQNVSGYKKRKITGYPSPQKLFTYFDTLSNFEHHTSDLFSLGIVAIQLYYPQQDLSSLYRNANSPYLNCQIDMAQLQALINNIKEYSLKEQVKTLTNQQVNARRRIFDLIKNTRYSPSVMALFQPNANEDANRQKVDSQLKQQPKQVIFTKLFQQKRQALGIEPIAPTRSFMPMPQKYQSASSSSIYLPPTMSTFSIGSQSYNGVNGKSLSAFDRYVPKVNSFNSPSVYNNYSYQPLSLKRANETLSFNSYLYPKPELKLERLSPKYLDTITKAPEDALLGLTYTSAQSQAISNNYDNENSKQVQKDQQLAKFHDPIINTHDNRTDQVQLNTHQKIVENSAKIEVLQNNQPLPLGKADQSEHNNGKKQVQRQDYLNTFEEQIEGAIISADHHQQEVKTDIQSPHDSLIGQLNQCSTLTAGESENSQIEDKDSMKFVVEEYQEGTRYEGFVRNGKRQGQGLFIYKEGSKYKGNWKENKMEGKGTLYYPNGMIAYEGDWKEDQFNGKGTVYNDCASVLKESFDYTNFNNLDQEWIKYEGQLKNDSKQGFGKLYLTNGQFYEGQFFNDSVHGEGYFKRMNGSILRGIWNEGLLKKICN